jgi:hypothetical protein
MSRWLRHIEDGTIYAWKEVLSSNPLVEEVTEEQAFPERFLKPKQVERVKKTRAKKNTKLDLATEDIPEPPAPAISPEIAREAAIGFPE